jgi:hypothetical protein
VDEELPDRHGPEARRAVAAEAALPTAQGDQEVAEALALGSAGRRLDRRPFHSHLQPRGAAALRVRPRRRVHHPWQQREVPGPDHQGRWPRLRLRDVPGGPGRRPRSPMRPPARWPPIWTATSASSTSTGTWQQIGIGGWMHTTPFFHATNLGNVPARNLVQIGIGGWQSPRVGVRAGAGARHHDPDRDRLRGAGHPGRGQARPGGGLGRRGVRRPLRRSPRGGWRGRIGRRRRARR